MINKTFVRNILFLALGITVLLFLGYFFLTNFGGAQSDISSTGVSMSEVQCQGSCQGLLAIGFNFNDCDSLLSAPDAVEYASNCDYPCNVTIKRSITCVVR